MNFKSFEDLKKYISGVTDKQESMSACDFPAETGVCTGFFPRYFFDRTTNICRQFIYGGCGGNQNNFGTEEECKKTCGTLIRIYKKYLNVLNNSRILPLYCRKYLNRLQINN